jgi:hypothetical protein
VTADPIVCYLSVDSMAFRSWNRGIAVTSPPLNSGLTTTAFGVWLYNGTRWFADPTFPGQSVCKGSTALWAGKLDYWVVGQIPNLVPQNWPALCRFDGVNFDWEPLAVPKAALAHVPIDPTTAKPAFGAIKSGACLAWNDCWFFGSYGVVLHWDGQSLTDATPARGTSPWLQSDFTAAVARTDAAGNSFGFAVAGTSAGASPFGPAALGQPTPPEPDGSPPPQLYRSSGGAFAPLSFSPPTTPLPGDPYQTDLVAVDFNSVGQGWVAGDPRSLRPNSPSVPATTEPAPLVALSASGAARPCPTTPADSFTYSSDSGYLWSTISVVPGGDALAGGWYKSPGGGGVAPVLAQVSCDQAPLVLGFGLGGSADDPGGWITAVAANATNDAWVAGASAQVNAFPDVSPTPHLYHLIDTDAPLAPTGDDNESRPLVVQSEPTIFVIGPAVVVPPRPPATTVIKRIERKTKRVKVPSPIYAMQRPTLVRSSKETFLLYFRFKVRAKVTIGIEALRGRRIVSSSGFKTFRGKTGELVLKLNVKRWPTSLKFVLPKGPGKK